MKKSIFLFFAALLCAVTVNAAYYYRGEKNASNGNWLDGIELTDADGYYAYFKTTGAHQFKICTDKSDWNKTNYNCKYVKQGYHSTDITEIGDWGGDNCYTWTSSDHYIIVYYPNTTINSSNDPIICASTFLPWDGGCYLMGNGDWDHGVEMKLNSSNNTEFILLDHQINGPFKIKHGNNKWTTEVENYTENGVNWVETAPGSGQYNITLPAGNYDFYFKKESQKVYIARNTVVTTTANPAEGGTLTGARVYNNDDDVTLTATANDGYKFVNWTKGGEQVSADATYAFKAAGDVELVANFVKTPTVTIEDPIGSMSTYTGVEENAGVWSKVYTAGDEVTIGVDQLGDGWLFAYWTIGGEKIFTEEYTFTVTEDVTITANYGMAMDVAFDNMVLDQDSWIVTAGPEAVFGIEVLLGIDTEGEHPKGFGLVDGSSISLGGEELELVTGYFTTVDPDAPSAEAVVFAVYEEMLMAFVCTMTAAPAPVHNIVVENATIDDQTETSGFLFMNGTWSDGTETYPVQAEIPGFDPNVASATYMVTITIGGKGDDDPWLGFGEGEVTVTVNDGLVTLSGSIENAGSGFAADVTISGTLPVPTPDYTRTVVTGEWGTICLPYASSSVTGATFYEVSSLVYGEGLWLDQLEDGAQLEAGKPYIFQATATEIAVTYTDEEVGAPVEGANGLTGTFTEITAGGLTGNYIIAENKVWVAGSGATLSANRAYIDATKVPNTAQAQLPGRRRVQMGENAATGLDNITNGENTVIKTIENGQLIIIRNGEKFNAQGVRF